MWAGKELWEKYGCGGESRMVSVCGSERIGKYVYKALRERAAQCSEAVE